MESNGYERLRMAKKKIGRRIMSRKLIIVLIYQHHELPDLMKGFVHCISYITIIVIIVD
jgi:hypothetical protein